MNQSSTLTFTITNPNPATDLTNVAFDDPLPSGIIIANPDSLVVDPVLGDCDPTATTGTITPTIHDINLSGGQIPANATCTFSIDVFAVSGGDQVNTTGAVSSTQGGTGGTATDTVTVVLPDLTITKTHSGNFQRGQVGVYTITVRNVGGADSTAGVTVTDTLPAGLTATAISGFGWSCSTPPLLQCSRADVVAAGASFSDITLTVSVGPNAASSVTNNATVSGGGESNTSNDTATDPTTVIPEPDLTITKTHTGSFQPGQTGTYTITVSNAGSGPTVGTVTVTDTLPSPLTGNAMSGAGWACNIGTLTCTRSDLLAAGASYPAITLVVNVPANAPGTLTNTVKVSGGGELNTANDTATDGTHVGTAAIAITANGSNLLVPRGGSSSMVFNVDAASGLGAITFSCGGLPPGVTCSFNPPSENQLSAQINMTVAAAAGLSSFLLKGPGRMPPVVLLETLLLFELGVLVWLLKVRPEGRRGDQGIATRYDPLSGRTSREGCLAQARLVLAVAALTLLLALFGCGGNQPPGPPQGSFPLTITGTSASGASGSTTVTLTLL